MKKTKRLLALAVAGSILLSFAGCGAQEEETAEEEAQGTPVEVMTVESGSIANESRLAGKVIAKDEVSIFTPLPAEVTSVDVSIGDTVTDGQKLFSVDPSDYQDNYKNVSEEYQRTKALYDEQIQMAQQAVTNTKTVYEEQLRQARESVENLKALYEIGAAAKTDLDSAESSLTQLEITADNANWQAEVALQQTQTTAKNTLATYEQNLKTLSDSIADCNAVKATISGVVTAVNVTKGSMASQQMAAVTIAGTQLKQVLVSVSETVVPYVKQGSQAEVTINALGGAPFFAEVDSVAPSSNQQTQLYDVYLNLPSDLAVSYGMFADVVFQTEQREDAVLIPTDAILTDGEVQYVYITIDQKTAKKVLVETGISAANGMTEVTSGLSGGEILVIKGESYLSDGSALRIVGGAGDE